MMTQTINPPDTAALLYHDAIARAADATAALYAAAMSKAELELTADQHRAAIASIKALALLEATDGKTEAQRNAAMLIALDQNEVYQQRVRDLAETERSIAERRAEIDRASMEHSIAKRQLDYAAAVVRGLS